MNKLRCWTCRDYTFKFYDWDFDVNFCVNLTKLRKNIHSLNLNYKLGNYV